MNRFEEIRRDWQMAAFGVIAICPLAIGLFFIYSMGCTMLLRMWN